ncbi:hypothetical protein PO377_19890, partial [Atlantibacter hermannii]|uniref:hypothetical protein n=1 Tax=Atlantibacter hermannii TaxID=565 RepID=UPI002FFD1375
ARASSGRYDRCNRLSVLYFPFSEATPVKKILNALNPACPGMAIRISWCYDTPVYKKDADC